MSNKRTRSRNVRANPQPTAQRNSRARGPQPQPRQSLPTLQSAASAHAAKTVCGLTDPFCKHANGAKYPDDSSARTLPYTFHGRQVVSTSTFGEARLLWSPQFMAEPLTDALTFSGSAVSSWNNFPAITPIYDASSYRIISSGFTIHSITAPLSASGEVSVRTFATQSRGLLTSPNLLSYNCSSSSDRALRLTDETAIITPHNSKMPQAFYASAQDSVNVASSQDTGYDVATIYIAGAPASTDVCIIEYFIHYELLFDPNSGLAQAATPSPPANMLITSAANRVSSTMPAIFEHGAKRLGAVLLGAAAKAVGARLGGPLGAAAANSVLAIMDS